MLSWLPTYTEPIEVVRVLDLLSAKRPPVLSEVYWSDIARFNSVRPTLPPPSQIHPPWRPIYQSRHVSFQSQNSISTSCQRIAARPAFLNAQHNCLYATPPRQELPVYSIVCDVYKHWNCSTSQPRYAVNITYSCKICVYLNKSQHFWCVAYAALEGIIILNININIDRIICALSNYCYEGRN